MSARVMLITFRQWFWKTMTSHQLIVSQVKLILIKVRLPGRLCARHRGRGPDYRPPPPSSCPHSFWWLEWSWWWWSWSWQWWWCLLAGGAIVTKVIYVCSATVTPNNLNVATIIIIFIIPYDHHHHHHYIDINMMVNNLPKLHQNGMGWDHHHC